MTSYTPAPILYHPNPPSSSRTPESRYWRRYKSPVYIKDYAPITHVQFAPSRPHRLCVTSGTSFKIYAPRTNKVVKHVTRFKETARSAEIRSDGNLCVAGSDDGLIQIFNLNSREVLRQFGKNTHFQPVHSVKFSPTNQSQLISGSDDTTVCLWDMTNAGGGEDKPLQVLQGHTDYVRSVSFIPNQPHLIVSGSYDTTVKIWDTRGQSLCTHTLTHTGSAIESVLPLPSGSSLLSAGGPVVRIWDLVAGGRCVKAVSNHQKTITSLVWDEGKKRVLSGALDGLVKVYEPSEWKVVHTMRYSSAILDLAISPDSTHIAAALSDSTLSIRQRAPPKSQAAGLPSDSALMNPSTYTSFLTTGAELGEIINAAETGRKGKPNTVGEKGEKGELKDGQGKKRKKLRAYDKELKAFRYGAALDAVLKGDIPPTTTYTVLSTLLSLGPTPLRIALSNRDSLSLIPLLTFLTRTITDTRFSALAIHVTEEVLDMYSGVLGRSREVDGYIRKLAKKVNDEVNVRRDVKEAEGMVRMVLAQAVLNTATTTETTS